MSDSSTFDPLFSSAEMRAVEEAYPGYPDSMRELMVRAGTAVAESALCRFPNAKAYTVVCGGGSNGGDGLVAADVLRSGGREVRVVEVKSGERELGKPDVIVDALFGTGFSGAPRADAAALIEQMNAGGLTLIVVTHDAEIGARAKRQIHMLDGRILSDERPS